MMGLRGAYTIQNWGYHHLRIDSDYLVGYWKLDESTAGDLVLNETGVNHGVPMGTSGANNLPQPTTAAPAITFTNSGALSFDGTDDHIQVNNITISNRRFYLCCMD